MHEYIQTYFDWINTKFPADKKHLCQSGSAMYGEVTYYSFCKIIEQLQLCEEDVFVDLGSGLGMAVFQSFCATSIKRAIGIECDAHRHQQGKKRLMQLQKDLPTLFEGRTFELIQGDFLSQDLSEVTVAYTCSTAFDAPLLQAIAEKLKSCSKLSRVLSFRKIDGLDDFRLSQVFSAECTWDTVNCYLYTRMVS